MYYSERPLSNTDIITIAEYLSDTDEDLVIALSELGFDPGLYDEDEMRDWLEEEAGLVQCQESGVWYRG